MLDEQALHQVFGEKKTASSYIALNPLYDFLQSKSTFLMPKK